jgi:hypothetical protein
MPPAGALFDFAFIDGDHRYQGVLNDLRALAPILNNGAYVLLHDAYHEGVDRAIREAVTGRWFRDAGRIGRVRNDLSPSELYGGFHLLLADR